MASPSAENTIVRLACSRLCGLPELVMYLNPPRTKNPVATNPATPVTAVMTLLMNESTWLIWPFAASALPGKDIIKSKPSQMLFLINFALVDITSSSLRQYARDYMKDD